MAASLEGVFRIIDRASPAIERIHRKAVLADRAVEKLGRSLDQLAARQAVQKLDNLGASMKNLEGDTNRVERAVGKATRAVRGNTSALDKQSGSVRRTRNEMGALEAAMRKVVIISTGFVKLLMPAKFLLILAAIRPLIGAVSALAAGATALVQQLVSATGAVVPLIARMGDLAGVGAVAATVMLSVKAATLTTKFAFDGVKQAINGSAAAMKKLTPEARAFVAEMKKLQPVLNQIRSSAQQGLFPGLSAATRQARRSGAFQVANEAAGGIGRAVGSVADQAANRFTSPEMLRDMRTQFATFDTVILRLGGAAINLADAFRHVLVAAQPLTRWVTSTVLEWSKYILQQTEIARQTGALGAYFTRTRGTLTSLGHVVRDFGMGFLNIMRVARGESGNFAGGIERIAKAFRDWTENVGNQARIALWFERAQRSAHLLGGTLVNIVGILVGIGRASQQLGAGMNEGIEGTTKRWSAWVNSFEGQNEINKWMNGMRETLSQIWGLVEDLSGAFGRLGAGGGGATRLAEALRGMVPDIERVLNNFTTLVGPGLFGSIQQLIHLLASITTTGASPLGTFLNMTNSILTAVNGILDRFSLVKTAIAGAVVALGAALLIQKLAKIAGGVGSIAVMWQRVTGATMAATGAANAYAGAAGRVAGPVGGGVPFGMAAGARVGANGAIVAPRTGLRGLVSRPGFGLGVGIGLPIAAGVGAQLAQSSGLMGSTRASQTMNVASMAGTGAMIGAMTPLTPLGGAAIGAGAGLLMNAMGAGAGHATPEAAFADRFGARARGQGFDITQAGGGAQTLAQQERYQRLLDRSLTALRARRAEAAKEYGTQSAIGRGMQENITRQIGANQRLRGENISRLGVLRAQAKALKDQTAELNAQKRAAQSRAIAGGLATSYGKAYNIYRKSGMTPGEATHLTVTNMLSRQKTLAPAGAKLLGQQGLNWLAEQKKIHPELQKEYDRWDRGMKKTLDGMGVKVSTAGGKILQTTTRQWQKIKVAMQDPAEKAAQNVAASFTRLQIIASGMLVGLGYTPAQAASIIKSMEAGAAGPAGGPGGKGAGAAGPGGSLWNVPTGLAPPAARGMRIPGTGLRDTAPVTQAMAAPGELIVNRHTERRVNGMLRRAGTSLGAEVAGEKRPHSDILPGYAMGGRLDAAIAEADRIDSLKSKYLYGGGHVTPAPATPPWDCSSATSRVLQAAGYPIPTMVSGNFMNWGEPGPGALGIAANEGHVYMMINGRAWGTSTSNPGGGAGWIEGGGYRPGFTIRHAPNVMGGGGAGGMAHLGWNGQPLLGAIPYGFAGDGLGAVPLAGALRAAHAGAVGLRGKINDGLQGMSLGGRTPEWGGWHAKGLDKTFKRPTLIGVGERGEERVKVGATATASGGGVTIHAPITIYAYHEGDVKREIDEAFAKFASVVEKMPGVEGES